MTVMAMEEKEDVREKEKEREEEEEVEVEVSGRLSNYLCVVSSPGSSTGQRSIKNDSGSPQSKPTGQQPNQMRSNGPGVPLQ
ncbi:hypothetical protein TWF730_011303 [Orbilia blumenaviensis]|uniref:Uncharacterized protein n=1 Tax=Orbilia blumenaviensis TaxID=1796055 RepID=A0AAV9UKR9_9PEZI